MWLLRAGVGRFNAGVVSSSYTGDREVSDQWRLVRRPDVFDTLPALLAGRMLTLSAYFIDMAGALLVERINILASFACTAPAPYLLRAPQAERLWVLGLGMRRPDLLDTFPARLAGRMLAVSASFVNIPGSLLVERVNVLPQFARAACLRLGCGFLALLTEPVPGRCAEFFYLCVVCTHCMSSSGLCTPCRAMS